MSYYGHNNGGGGGGGYQQRGRDDDRGGGYYGGGGGGGPDRSRSRNHTDRDTGRRGYNAGGGRGGHGGYRGGRGGRGRGGPRAPRPESVQVLTNFFELNFLLDDVEYYQYHADIINASRKKDENGEFVLKAKEGDRAAMNLDDGPTPLSRRILEGLRAQENLFFASVGSETVIAPSRLFPEEEKAFFIRVKKECEESDPEAYHTPNKWYQVKLKQAAVVTVTNPNADMEQVRQNIDIIQKSALLSVRMKAYGKSPRSFYFPENEQRRIMDRLNGRSSLVKLYREANLIKPMIGLTQNVRVCEGGKLFLVSDSKVDFQDMEFQMVPRGGGSGERLPILDQRKGTIAGEKVADLNRPIENIDERNKVEKALKKITFNIVYTVSEENQRAQKERKGWDDARIKSWALRIRKNCTMKSIVWQADDPDLYSFPFNSRKKKSAEEEEKEEEEKEEPIMHTVASYYLEVYGIQLQYPHLPLVAIRRDKEYFPVEFLYRAGGKTKGENSNDRVQSVLGYYDENAGFDCVRNVTNLSNIACEELMNQNVSFQSILENFRLVRNREPVTLTAEVLPEPILDFKRSRPSLNNGGWNLRNAEFSSPSQLSSFAIVDFAGQGGKSVTEFTNCFLQQAQAHKMVLPLNVDLRKAIGCLTVNGQGASGTVDVARAFDDAVQSARDFFLLDTKSVFFENHTWFKTRVRNPGTRRLEECFVFPHKDNDGRTLTKDRVGLILEQKTGQMVTHQLEDPNHDWHNARIMVRVRELQDAVDPFDFDYDCRKRQYMAKDNNEWVPVTLMKHVYKILGGEQNGREIDIDTQGLNTRPELTMSLQDLECPSLLLTYLPNKDAGKYHVVKMVSHFRLGIPNQCVVQETFARQSRNPEQFCSNIVLKVNAKLANSLNKAQAWSNKIPWVHEVPTLVIGISISSGYGESSISVVSATASLSEGNMPFAEAASIQSKTELIDRSIMKDLTRTLLEQYKVFNDRYPKRMLIYRTGVSEGSLARLRNIEINSIREACNEHMECSPPITYVVAMKQHNMRVVPDQAQNGRDKNVPSGTCVDHTIMDLNVHVERISIDSLPEGHTRFSTEETCFDIVLTAQGGLKGTSKPVFHRVILNENAEYGCEGASALTKELFKKATYHMSYQYSTATKAVRSVPVLFYAERSANLIINYFKYLKERRGGENTLIETIELGDLNEEEKQNSRINTDETSVQRFKYVRRDLREQDGENRLAPYLKTVILKDFNPIKGAPFFTHVSC